MQVGLAHVHRGSSRCPASWSSTTSPTSPICSRPPCVSRASTVEAAGTGTEALDKVRTYRPDLVMLDVMLPDLDGHRGLPPPARPGRPVPGRLPDRPRRHRGQGGRPGRWATTTSPSRSASSELVARIRPPSCAGPVRWTAADEDRPALRRSRHGRRHPRGVAPRARRSSSPPPSSTCCATCSRTPAGSSPSPRSSTTCGATGSTGDPTSSRPTSATCARRSTCSSPPLIHTIRRVGYTLRLPREGVSLQPAAGRRHVAFCWWSAWSSPTSSPTSRCAPSSTGASTTRWPRSQPLAFNYVAFATVRKKPLSAADLSRHVSPDVYVLIFSR